MQDTVTFESYPTHPLARRDSWPASGPIYGIGEPDRQEMLPRTLWQRLTATDTEISKAEAMPSGTSPVWY